MMRFSASMLACAAVVVVVCVVWVVGKSDAQTLCMMQEPPPRPDTGIQEAQGLDGGHRPRGLALVHALVGSGTRAQGPGDRTRAHRARRREREEEQRMT